MILPQAGAFSAPATAATGGSSSSSSISGASDDEQREASQLWAVLMARSLLLLGKMLKHVCQPQQRAAFGGMGSMLGGASQQQQPDPVTCETPHDVMDQCFEAVEWLRPHLKLYLTAGSEQQQQQQQQQLAVQQQLFVQATELQKLFMNAVQRSQEMFEFCDNEAALSKETQRVMQGSGLGQKLEAFGHAVCTQLPLRHCCNNPACINMDRLSELELASFALCSACKAAVYCSKDCQKVHWGQPAGHKEVCKRIQAAAAAAASQ